MISRLKSVVTLVTLENCESSAIRKSVSAVSFIATPEIKHQNTSFCQRHILEASSEKVVKEFYLVLATYGGLENLALQKRIYKNLFTHILPKYFNIAIM